MTPWTEENGDKSCGTITATPNREKLVEKEEEENLQVDTCKAFSGE